MIIHYISKIDAKVLDYWLMWLYILRCEMEKILHPIKSIHGDIKRWLPTKMFALNHDCFCHRMHGLAECDFQQNSCLYRYRDFYKKRRNNEVSQLYIHVVERFFSIY